MENRRLLRACMELATVNASLARILSQIINAEQPTRKPPARAAKVIEMRRAA